MWGVTVQKSVCLPVRRYLGGWITTGAVGKREKYGINIRSAQGKILATCSMYDTISNAPSSILLPERPCVCVWLAVLLLLANQEKGVPPVLDGHVQDEGLPASQGFQRGDLRSQIS